MKQLFTLMLFIFASTSSGIACEKCEMEKVKIVNQHLNSLTFQILSDFLCTFDSVCSNNAEFSEWSNETLFKVLEKSPTIYFKVLAQGLIDNKLLIKEIENPGHEFDLQKIYNKVKIANAPTEIKSKYLNALISLADKHGNKIRK